MLAKEQNLTATVRKRERERDEVNKREVYTKIPHPYIIINGEGKMKIHCEKLNKKTTHVIAI